MHMKKNRKTQALKENKHFSFLLEVKKWEKNEKEALDNKKRQRKRAKTEKKKNKKQTSEGCQLCYSFPLRNLRRKTKNEWTKNEKERNN